LIGDHATLSFDLVANQLSIESSNSIGGKDSLTSGSGRDILLGGADADSLNAGSGDNTSIGDFGFLVFNAITRRLKSFASRFAAIGGQDTFESGSGSDLLIGGAGHDSFIAGGGDDVLIGDLATVTTLTNADNSVDQPISQAWTAITKSDPSVVGNDTYSGGVGQDIFAVTAGVDSITDLSGFDVLDIEIGATANAQVTLNWIATAASDQDGTANLTLADGAGLVVNLFADTGSKGYSVTGGSGNDTIVGTIFGDSLVGGAGNDSLTGGDGNDSLSGGLGNDQVTGGLGNDLFAMTAGIDSITDLNGSDVLDVENGATANAVVTANWTATAASQQDGSANLTLVDGAGLVVNLSAALGSNGYSVTGGTGNDSILGTAWADSFSGGAGNDSLSGGLGNDSLTGGGGTDLFAVTAGMDDISDVNGSEVLDIETVATGNAFVTANWTASASSDQDGIANLTLANGV
jgi:Ca2+-binding RTX toxin-like protein